MKKEEFSEDLVVSPTGVEYHSQMEHMRNILSLVEEERDNALNLLREVIEIDDVDDMEEVLTRIKEFIENGPFTDAY